MNYPRIKDAYPDLWSGNGVFTDLSNFDVPWSDSVDATYLDILFANHSGEKIQSRMIRNNTNTDGVLDSSERETIANTLYTMFSFKWGKLWDTVSLQYNPIENYRMVETETIERDETRNETHTGTDTHAVSRQNTDTGTIRTVVDGQVVESGTVDTDEETTNNRGLYGFNSQSAVDADTETRVVDGTETRALTTAEDTDTTETHNLTKGESGTDTETKNLADSSTAGEDTERELTRSGNIGVTTSQQMIESERTLWNWLYFEGVFNDIDSVLALSVY